MASSQHRTLSLLRKECPRHCPSSKSFCLRNGVRIRLKDKVDAIMGNFVKGKKPLAKLTRSERKLFLSKLPWLRSHAKSIEEKRRNFFAASKYNPEKHSESHEKFKDCTAQAFADRVERTHRVLILDDFCKDGSRLRQTSALLARGVEAGNICLANPDRSVVKAARRRGCRVVESTLEEALKTRAFGPRLFDGCCIDLCYSDPDKVIRCLDLALKQAKQRVVVSWTITSRHSAGISFMSRFLKVYDHLVNCHGFQRPASLERSYETYGMATTQVLRRS
jgi:hypothetical protein